MGAPASPMQAKREIRMVREALIGADDALDRVALVDALAALDYAEDHIKHARWQIQALSKRKETST